MSAHREAAYQHVRDEKPLVVIGSPPCTPFSQLQTLNPDTPQKRKNLKEGEDHMRCMISIYKMQVEEGRIFLHEHPSHAKSWHMKEVRSLMATQGVALVEADQCMYGLKTWSANGAKLSLAKKPTIFMTNSRAMGRELERKCNGAHEHQPLLDGRASAAARYPQGLCRAICRGIVKAKMEREKGIRAVMEIAPEQSG